MIHLERTYFDTQLGDVSPFTAGIGAKVDELWEGITAPPGKGKTKRYI